MPILSIRIQSIAAASCSGEERNKSLFPNYHCSIARYYLGFIYKEEPAFNNNDGVLLISPSTGSTKQSTATLLARPQTKMKTLDVC
eukprot:CAMPEP_0202482706 /NCGR_PEP_ID=MMETSP1361-20130828/2083_1 /ASSEMBLY_ACC=CAM_ASM_000849 /TAXON_ID=210615 /ORGANISM="Staurosira complex sp., Strain CCMP2646" /LENGTH=85 /DNA_ID=CAMNT_0049110683 /DNA_START=135 /DNA_END=392 /DNA_ORIENTATION=+